MLAQEFPVIFDAVGVEVLVAGEKLPPPALIGQDDIAQLTAGERLVADEIDLGDPGLRPSSIS